MKTYQITVISLTGVVALSTIASATVLAERPSWAGGQMTRHSNNNQQKNTAYNMTPQTTTSSEDSLTLQHMVEEEKLAHDVYNKLYETWGEDIFATIANSESKHQSKIAMLLDSYGVDNPASNQEGVFVNDELQKLYQDMIAKGLQSKDAAIEVGIAIEEADITDLEEAIASTDNTRIQRVFTNLLRASNKHLEHFQSLQ
jgi:hypothetical protein